MPNIELLNCDCMSYMATLPDKAFDLAIVDPIYGVYQSAFRISKPKGAATKTKKYNNIVFRQHKTNAKYFRELIRVSKNQIVWGANYFSHSLCEDKQWIFWNKNTEAKYGDGELAYTSFDGALRKFDFTWNGMIQNDMKNKESRIHPTQKPVALYKWLLHNYAKPGDKILDTHLGSGSSAIAAHKMGFDFVGCELDFDYHAAAVKRFKEQTAQLSLL